MTQDSLSDIAAIFKRQGIRGKVREFATVFDVLLPSISIAADRAEAFSMSIRDTWHPGKYYPVIVGSEKSATRLCDMASAITRSPSDLIEMSEQLCLDAVLKELGRDKLRDEELELAVDELPSAPVPWDLEFDPLKPLGSSRVEVVFVPLNALGRFSHGLTTVAGRTVLHPYSTASYTNTGGNATKLRLFVSLTTQSQFNSSRNPLAKTNVLRSRFNTTITVPILWNNLDKAGICTSRRSFVAIPGCSGGTRACVDRLPNNNAVGADLLG